MHSVFIIGASKYAIYTVQSTFQSAFSQHAENVSLSAAFQYNYTDADSVLQFTVTTLHVNTNRLTGFSW